MLVGRIAEQMEGDESTEVRDGWSAGGHPERCPFLVILRSVSPRPLVILRSASPARHPEERQSGASS